MSADPGEGTRHLVGRIESLMREVAELRAEVRTMSQNLEQMQTTFRQLAMHLGIAAEPYRSPRPVAREPPTGFG